MAFQPRFETLVDIFEHSTKTFAKNELFGTKKGGTWTFTTYEQFGKEVDAIRGALSDLGIGKGDVVAIIANNRVEWAVFAYATYGLGASFVPMYEAQLPKEWEFIAKDCGAKVLVCATSAIVDKAAAFFDVVPSLASIVTLEEHANGKSHDARIKTYRALLEAGKTAPLHKPAKDDPAGLIYTSGTTGNPKGVILTHQNLAYNVSAIHEIFPMTAEDRSLAFLPWAHSFGQTVELHALVSMGASIAICEAIDKILDNLAEVRPTLLFSVPRIYNKIYTAVQKQIAGKPSFVQALVKRALATKKKERAGEPIGLLDAAITKLADKLVFSKVRARFGGRLKYAFSGGAAISKEVAEFIDSLGVVVYEGYGLTETSPIATANCPSGRTIGSVGRAIPGVRIVIDPETGEKRPAEGGKPERFEGEIVVYGHNVMKGYHKRDDENAAVFTTDGGFRTGDMGYLDSDGFLFITGRIKEQYKLENGKYVVPTPLEEHIKLSPYVLNVMVYGDNKPYNVALIVANKAAVSEWAKQVGLSLGEDDAIPSHSDVRSLFQAQLEEHGKAFKGYESIQDFAIILTDFTTDNGMLTPSLKLKRRAVMEAYGRLIEELYTKKRAKPTTAAAAGS